MDLKPLGKVVITDDKTILSSKECAYKKTVSSLGEVFYGCVKDAEKLSKEEMELAVYVAALLELEGYHRGVIRHKKHVYFFVKYENFYYIYKAEADNETPLEQLAEAFFKGSSYYIVEHDLKQLRKDFLYIDTKAIVSIGTLFLVLLGGILLVYTQIFEEENQNKVYKKPPEPKPLTSSEMRRIKNKMSLDIFNDIKKEVADIASSDLYKKRKKIINYKIARTIKLRPLHWRQDPRTKRYYIPKEKINVARGGLKITIAKQYQMSFPQVGYKLKGDSYIKNETVVRTYGKKEIIPQKPLTKECLEGILQNKAYPYFRHKDTIEMKFSGVSPSLFVKKASKVAENCPFYFKKIEIKKGKIYSIFVVYK